MTDFNQLRHVRQWIFDLDLTLYDHSVNLLPQIDTRMVTHIAEVLAVSHAEADRLRALYLAEHGTTLAGLVANHRIDPVAFLEQTHAVDYSSLGPAQGLGDAIAALPGRKIIHTNGPRGHAGAVLSALGLSDHFEAVFTIEDTNLVSKPRPDAYAAIWGRAGIDPAQAAMIEDNAANLAVPAAAGMGTVWLDHGRAPHHPTPAHVSHRTASLHSFLGGLTGAGGT